MLEKEMIEIAKGYKKKTAGSFVLVDGDEMAAKIAGTQFVATKKMDGIFQCLFFDDGKICGVGTSGKIVSGLPCMQEVAEQLKKYGLKSAVIEAELYAVLQEGKRERVGDVAKALTDESLAECLYLAPFDITMLDGENYHSDSYGDTIKKLCSIFKGSKAKSVEYKELTSINEVEELYKQWTEAGAEGIVLHTENPIVYKIKPRHSVDGVIVGFTCGEGENADSIRDVAVALMPEEGKYQIIGVTGGGFTDEQRKTLALQLEPLSCESEYIITDSRNVAYQMVKPQIIAEFTAGDYVSESNDGTPKMNPVLSYEEKEGYLSEGNTSGVSVLHMVFERIRDDKSVNVSDLRISQVTDICPFQQGKVAKMLGLPESQILAKRIFTKGAGEKMMIQKYVVWKTNKEDTGMFPAYVFFYTDFSSGRKDMLKRDLKVSSDKGQALVFMDEAIAQNVKKGWNEV